MKNKGFRTGIVSQLVGLSYDRIDYYDKHGIVSPDIQKANGPGSRRLYSNANLAELNVLRKLMDRGITLGKVRKALFAARNLFPKIKRPLQGLRFLSDGLTIYARRSDGDHIIDLLDVQQPVFEPLIAETSEPVDSSIREIDAADIDTVVLDGKVYLVELIEEADGKGVVARCPDLYGISVKGHDSAAALDKIRARIGEARNHLHP